MARCLVAPLKDSWVSPNHLTTIRLAVGLAGALAFVPGTYAWSNLAATLIVLSNFLDHTDGEFARLCGKTSRFGHLYDLASDAVITVLLFVAIDVGVDATADTGVSAPSVMLGALAGSAVALIFFLRMRIEEMAGKSASRQASIAGFETEDVLYLLPLVTAFDVVAPFLLVASIGAPMFAIWVIADYRRVKRGQAPVSQSPSGAT